jgi:hypothetical protein
MNSFDLVRKLKMPGLVLSATLNPTHLSTRIKKSAQTMLRTGIMTGGYRSQAREVACQLLADANLKPLVSFNKHAVALHNLGTLPDAVKDQICDLLEAVKVIEIAGSRSLHTEYIADRYAQAIANVRENNGATYLHYLYEKSLAAQIAQLAASCRTPERAEQDAALAAKLDSTESIVIDLFADTNF